MSYPSRIEKLIDLFSKFPGVGPKTASRFVFYLLRKQDSQIDEFLEAVVDLKKSVSLCKFCRNPFEPNTNQLLCSICSNPLRDKTLLCLVEKETDLMLLEKTNKYPGLYFILGSLLTPLKKKETEKIVISNLLKRLKEPLNFGIKADFKEVIIAISDTTEGQATALYLERELAPLKLKISRLGRGLPLGAEIEYADEETLSSALEGRK
ncbi:recombination mediator RecR [Candidatus Parcubacteria bacterium]|nr:recombination mediator RecR [Patescibacteria group bacterium]MBU4466540.1 recombination mediator RecR [Patescibacteria group bacterium]MCG2688816.1 recombination mediator RecR [Candidatus Parcubacteria bacterium]